MLLLILWSARGQLLPCVTVSASMSIITIIRKIKIWNIRRASSCNIIKHFNIENLKRIGTAVLAERWSVSQSRHVRLGTSYTRGFCMLYNLLFMCRIDNVTTCVYYNFDFRPGIHSTNKRLIQLLIGKWKRRRYLSVSINK